MSTSPTAWALPFLAQARQDLDAAWATSSTRSGATLCMLLQMVFEKLAKAAYARRGSVIPKTHRAASHLFTNLLRTPHGIKLLQVTPEIGQFVAELEEAHPSHAGQQVQPCPQLEYPWEDPIAGVVFTPASDLSLARRVLDPRDRIALDALRFARAIEQNFEVLFP